ncbi:MAG: rod shape-determining protein MreD [Megasphaera sp.]|nr:rod shape-determining protein MreD [Megasphaera sp.]
MRKMACFMMALAAFILQSSIFPFIFNGIYQPNIIFVLVVLIALHHGQRAGIIAALLGGFCQDVIIGNFFGLHLLPYLVIAFICSAMGRNVEREQWLLSLVIVLVATECCLLLTCGVLLMSGQFVKVMAYLFEYSVPMLVYHGILALPLDHFVWKLRREDAYGFFGYRW